MQNNYLYSLQLMLILEWEKSNLGLDQPFEHHSRVNVIILYIGGIEGDVFCRRCFVTPFFTSRRRVGTRHNFYAVVTQLVYRCRHRECTVHSVTAHNNNN